MNHQRHLFFIQHKRSCIVGYLQQSIQIHIFLYQTAQRFNTGMQHILLTGRNQPQMTIGNFHSLILRQYPQHRHITIPFDTLNHDIFMSGASHLIQYNTANLDALVKPGHPVYQSRYTASNACAVYYQKHRCINGIGQLCTAVAALYIQPVKQPHGTFYHTDIKALRIVYKRPAHLIRPHHKQIQISALLPRGKSHPAWVNIIRPFLERLHTKPSVRQRFQKPQCKRRLARTPLNSPYQHTGNCIIYLILHRNNHHISR